MECVLKVSTMRPLSLDAVAASLAAGETEIDMAVPWTLVLMATRRLAKEISRKMGLGLRVDISAFHESLSAASSLLQHGVALHSTVRSSWQMRSDTIYNLGTDPSTHTTTFISFIATFILVIRRQFTRWREDRAQRPPQGVDEATKVREAKEVATAEAAMRQLLAEAVTLIGCLINERRHGAGIEVVTHLSSFAPIKFSMSKWALVALSLPCHEAGGASLPLP